MEDRLFSTFPQNLKIRSEYSTLVLSGGGEKGIIHLGFLHSLILKNTLQFDRVENFVGTSIGSIICLLFIIGMKPVDILSKLCFNESATEMKSDIFNIVESFGLINPQNFFKVVEDLVVEAVGFVPTLLQLYKLYKKHFVCVSHNLSANVLKGEKNTIYIDYLSFPNLSCIDAIRMSCNIPLVFTKFMVGKEYYIDGAVSDNYPIEYAYKNFNGYILGIHINQIQSEQDEMNIFNYIRNLISISYRDNNYKSVSFLSDRTHTISVTSDKENFSLLSVTSDKKFKLFSLGYTCGEKISQQNSFVTDKDTEDESLKEETVDKSVVCVLQKEKRD